MHRARFRFYEELNRFLPQEKRKTEFGYEFRGRPTVKDAVEAIGVPHTEIDLILVNGESVDFSYHLNDGDTVSVYPVFEGLDITPVAKLRAKPLREIRFILDVHLGRLAKYLRLCGFDTLFSNYYTDPEIIETGIREKRIILTRDKGLLKNRNVTHGYLIRSQDHAEQLREVFLRFDLKGQVRLFTRCIRCNTLLVEVEKEEIADRLQANTSRYYSTFSKCPGCDRIYWEGSHYDNMKKSLEGIL